MNLAPGERRALAGIENELRRSDPWLAAMLATFTTSLTLCLAICLARAFRRRVTRRLALALALPAACVFAMSWVVISQPAQPRCPPGMQASVPGQTGGFCDRTDGSASRPSEDGAGSQLAWRRSSAGGRP
jgi:hypothetical protein